MSANLRKILSRKKIVYVSEKGFLPKGTMFSRDRNSFLVTYSFKGMPKGKRGYEKRKERVKGYEKEIYKIAKDLGLSLDITPVVNYDALSIGYHPEITIEGLPLKNKSVQFLKQVEKLIGYREK